MKVICLLASIVAVCLAHSHGAAAPATIYGIFRHDCYDSFTKLEFSDTSCVSFTFSKVVGFAIVLGAFILKVPQILKILSSGSVEGISALSYYVETINFLATAALSIHLGLDFWVYGETFVITVQNLIIILMIWSMDKKISIGEKILFVTITAGVVFLMFEASLMTEDMWALVSSSSILLNMSARVPQILQNFSAKSTGQNAFATFFLNWAGGIARTATVVLNSDDFMYTMQFVIALGLNTIIIM